MEKLDDLDTHALVRKYKYLGLFFIFSILCLFFHIKISWSKYILWSLVEVILHESFKEQFLSV